MTTDPRDTAIGVSCPVVAVPRFGALEPHASGQRMLLARNGLFVQMKTPWLDCTTRVAEVGMHLPYGVAAEAITFAFGVIPLGLLERFIAAARAALPNEAAGALVYDARSGALRLAMHEAIEVGPAHVRYRIEELAADELAQSTFTHMAGWVRSGRAKTTGMTKACGSAVSSATWTARGPPRGSGSR